MGGVGLTGIYRRCSFKGTCVMGFGFKGFGVTRSCVAYHGITYDV